jgi:hypothetical protein
VKREKENKLMFMMQTPKDFKIGDTKKCRINFKPARITWKDANTLVIEPGDERAILHTQIDGELRVFMCGDDNRPQGSTVEKLPGGVIVTAPLSPGANPNN